MRTLKEENRHRLELRDRQEQEKYRTRVACDLCGKEMSFLGNIILATIPPKREVVCSHCRYINTLIV